MCDSSADDEELKFTFGLIASNNKYLTAEAFGYKLSATGKSMKKKMIWSLEQKEDGSVVYFKSCLDRYLGTDNNGKVSCDAEKPDKDNCFQVEATADGRWAIKSATYGRYFGGSGDSLDCFGQSLDNNRFWTVHLAMHPQINLFSVSRKRFAHLKNDQLEVTRSTPWGVETLITLVYKDRGYGLITSDNRYLNKDGELSAKFDVASTSFTLEFYSGSIAFKSKGGKYLSPQGPHGTLKGWKSKVTKDEKFTMKESHPQVTLYASARKKYVSTRQGVQVICNQCECEKEETFQMEIQPSTGRWSFRDSQDKFWTVKNGNVMANKDRTADSWFDIKWNGSTIHIFAANGQAMGMKSGGNLLVKDDCEPVKFMCKLINRPVVVFRGEEGFIGHKATKLDGNKSNFDIYEMQENEGVYCFKASHNDYYWKVGDNGRLCMDKDTKDYFTIELRKRSLLAIRSEKTGNYVKSDNIGILTADGKADEKAILWEY